MFENMFNQLVIKDMQITNKRDGILKLINISKCKRTTLNIDKYINRDSKIQKKKENPTKWCNLSEEQFGNTHQ